MSDGSGGVRVTFDGRAFDAAPGTSLLQALAAAGHPLTRNVGCLGQGVCGACRILLRRGDAPEVTTALACETLVEDDMQAVSIDHFPPTRQHHYQLSTFGDGWDVPARVNELFPEAARCRHCGGCDRACPKGIEVERMVGCAVEGRVYEAAELFEHCITCNLCVAACPEHIEPAQLGLLTRRLSASSSLRPADLLRRLLEIEQGQQPIVYSAPPTEAPPAAMSPAEASPPGTSPPVTTQPEADS